MITSRLPQKRRRRRSGLRFLFIFTATTAMIITGGFGAFPDNPLTQTFRKVIGENIPADFLNPFNSYMESISAPRIPPRPVSASENDSPPDPLGFFEDLFGGDDSAPTPLSDEAAFIETAMVSIEGTQTQSILLTSTASSPISTQSLAPTGTQAFTPTLTSNPSPSLTTSPVPTATIAWVLPTSTKPPPTRTFTPAFTPTFTPGPPCSISSSTAIEVAFVNSSPTETVNVYWVDFACNLSLLGTYGPGQSSAGTTITTAIGHVYRYTNASTGQLLGIHTMSAPGTLDVWTGSFSVTGDFSASSVSLNGDGSSIVVAPGQTVNVTYNFNIWDDPCPGCSTQLVTGLLTGTTGVHGGSCAFAGDAGLYPGASGSENVNLTAPLAPGVYYVTASYQWQFTCAQALTAYAGGTTGRAIGQIEVLGPSVVLYEGGTSAGNIGPRASADAICAANLPAGYANYHAFIGYSASDSIANMPANYGIPTNIPIRSASNILIANNWTDLMDGTIVTSLTGAGVAPDGYWWSGVDNASGIHTDGVTQDCTDWTSNLNATPGTLGSTIFNDSNWMFITSNAACDPVYSILCIGY